MSLKQIRVKRNCGTCWEISQQIIYEKNNFCRDSILDWKKKETNSSKRDKTTNQILSALIGSWLLKCRRKCFKAHYNCNLGKPSIQPAGEPWAMVSRAHYFQLVLLVQKRYAFALLPFLANLKLSGLTCKIECKQTWAFLKRILFLIENIVLIQSKLRIISLLLLKKKELFSGKRANLAHQIEHLLSLSIWWDPMENIWKGEDL